MGKLNSLMEGIERVVNEEKWSADVKTKWSPPEGFFKQDAGKIASGLMSASKDGAQAMERLNFYINRAGANLSSEDKARLEDAKKKLSAMISKEEDVDLEEASKGEYVVKLSGSKAFKKGEAEIKRFDRSGFKVVQGGVSGKLTRWPSAMPHEDSMIKIVKVHSPDDGEQVLIATLAEDLDEAKKGMQDADVFTTSLSKHTLDEAKGAYKSSSMIEEAIEPTCSILHRVRPVINVKDSTEAASWKERREKERDRKRRTNRETDDMAFRKMRRSR